MKRVLLTGASGFIGRQALPHLLAAGYEVHAVSRKGGVLPPEGVAWHCADLLDEGQQADLLRAVRPSHLLHLAWYVETGQYVRSPRNIDWVKASLELMRQFAAAGGRRWVGVGTCTEYRAPEDGLCVEDQTPLEPASLYATAKHALWLIQSHLARELGLSAAWGRIFYLYGPHEPPERVVASVTRALLRGEKAATTAGQQVRDFLHVEDVARALVTILDSDFCGAVNVGSGAGMRVREVVELVGEIAGRPELLEIGGLPARAGEPARIVADVARLRSLGFVPRYGLREGLAQTVAWWREAIN